MIKTSQHKYLSFDISLWEKILEEQYIQKEQKRQNILADLTKKLKAYFKEKNVKSVYLFGSILKEGCFYEFSDIDIAVEGLKEDYFQVCTEIERLIDFDIDLVEMEKCKFSDFIKKCGIELI